MLWDGEMIYLIGQMHTQLWGDTELILRSARLIRKECNNKKSVGLNLKLF